MIVFGPIESGMMFYFIPCFQSCFASLFWLCPFAPRWKTVLEKLARINLFRLFEMATLFSRLDAVGERTNLDPVVQGVNPGARINHP